MLEGYDKIKRRDYLLHVLTARQEVSYSQLKGIVEDLYRTVPGDAGEEAPERPVTFIMSQALEALGHCNFDFRGDSSMVHIRPPSLDRLPVAGQPTAVLTGARSPKTVSLLAEKCKSHEPRVLNLNAEPASEDLPFIPLRVELQARESSYLAEVANEVGLSYHPIPPAFKLSSRLGTIEDYLQSLATPRTGELENWPGRRDYFPDKYRFRKKKQDTEGPRLVRYSHPHTGGERYFLFRGNQRQEVDREWGRYAVLRETPLRPLVHDQEKMLVAIPNGARLPTLQARALSLCSGYAPGFFETDQISIKSKYQIPRPEQFGYHVYRWVDPRVIRAVADSLDQYRLDATIEI